MFLPAVFAVSYRSLWKEPPIQNNEEACPAGLPFLPSARSGSREVRVEWADELWISGEQIVPLCDEMWA